MELRHLRYFEAVVTAGNVTQAAAALHISQPSLSQAIKELEAELGVPLLVRGSRGSRPTEAGREFIKHATDILERIPAAREASRRAAIGIGGQLVVAVTGSSVFDVVPVIMRAASEHMPDVRLRLVEMLTDKQIDALNLRQVDAAIGRTLSGEPGLTSRVIAKRSFVVAVHVRHPLARQRSIMLADLQNQALIVPQRRVGPGFHAQLMALLTKAKLNLRIAHEVTHLPTVLGLVAAGLGVGVVSDELHNLEVRDVIYRPLVEGRGALELSVSWRHDNEAVALAQFIRLCSNQSNLEIHHVS
jgi:LysR family transcriptional regulator, benzoate and cis,cis-muconate-responsive activator of ben and cat genes